MSLPGGTSSGGAEAGPRPTHVPFYPDDTEASATKPPEMHFASSSGVQAGQQAHPAGAALPPDTSSIIAQSPSAGGGVSPLAAHSCSQSPLQLEQQPQQLQLQLQQQHHQQRGPQQQSQQQQTQLLPTRRAACTHVKLTRIYGPYKCHHCGRVPRLGWVYRCSQDLGDELVGFSHRNEENFTTALQKRLQQESESRTTHLPPVTEDSDAESRSRPTTSFRSPGDGPAESAQRLPLPQAESTGPRLKPWMHSAMERGGYSEEQVCILKAQRQLVLERVASSAYPEPPEQAELQDVLIADPATMMPNASSSYYSRRYRRQFAYAPSRSRSTTIAPYWQRPNPPRQPATDLNRQPLNDRNVNVFGPHGSFTPSDQQLQQGELQQPSICVYQTCSTCRPAMRDRTWQCLDPRHFTVPPNELQLPNPATDNRIMSHPALVQSACYKFQHPDPIPDPMLNSFFSAGDFSDDYDDDDDDFDLTTSGYDSSDISPDASSEGTPTMQYYDESRGWDRSSRWMAPAPTPPSAPFRYGQPMPSAAVSYGNPLSGYGPNYYGQRRILRRASSMDPRLLRSAHEMAEMADIGPLGLGLSVGLSANEPSPEAQGGSGQQERHTGAVTRSNRTSEDIPEEREEENEEDHGSASAESGYNRSGAVSALDIRPSLDEQLREAITNSGEPPTDASEEVIVHDGIAVTEEAVESGEADVIMEPRPETPRPEERIALFG